MSHIHIFRGTNVRYRAMVRGRGCRNYKPAGPWESAQGTAARRMLKKFMEGTHWKRGEVWMIADYYDPIPLMTITR